MEDIIQTLFYVAVIAIAIISRITNNKEKTETPSPEEVLEDVFPNIETYQEEPVNMTPSPEAAVQETVVPEQTFSPVETTPSVIIPHTSPPTLQNPVKTIRINTRKEARKAFIYSEIFNRKY